MKLTVNGKTIECAPGATYRDAAEQLGLGRAALGVFLGGATISLLAPVEDGAQARFITLADEEGRRIYERTLQFVMLAAARRALPGRKLRIEHSFGEGVYAHVPGESLSQREVNAVRARMRELVETDAPIVPVHGTKAAAMEYFGQMGQNDKLRLIRYRYHEHFPLYELDGMREYFYGEMAPSAGYVAVHALVHYHPGMVTLMPDPADFSRPAAFRDMPKLARVFAQSAKWGQILGCANVADLNEMAEKKRLREFIRINEALHERSIEAIADQFAASGARVILIAGPSSSGKTTFAHRLLIALKVLGYRPIKLSLDDYYVDRDKIPLEADGRPDLERIETLDLELLNEQLLQLLQGEVIAAPVFDFVRGRRQPETHPVSVESGQPIIIEGIHGLNDALTSAVPRDMKFKIYISALTTLNLDDHNRIRTTDARLLRRIVRDNLFRGTPPEDTMLMWDSVRRGEEKYIFPYQEQADVMFNSSLAYELPIMKKYAYPALCQVPKESPCYTRARRLVKFLNYFTTADVEDEIPVNSILREFIGGCCFYREED